ncbi:MAG: hypothetical protein KC656_04200 [Myxococcales bacterium]|nr:hypothetical protein [Myxococcales bacterium]
MEEVSPRLWERVWDAVGPVDPAERAAWLHGEPDGDPDTDASDEDPALDAGPPDPRFRPWDLQDEATLVEGDARRAVLDAAIAAFDAIADAPIDPGNDEGPFFTVADLMDLDQVQRAFGVLERMAPHPWCYRSGGSRAALLGRLAQLGRHEEAEARMAGFDSTDPFVGHWRAVACGRRAAAALGQEPLQDVLARVGFGAMSDEERLQVVMAMTRAPPPHDALEALNAVGTLTDARRRAIGVGYLAVAWWEALPAEVWIEAVEAGPDGGSALLGLVNEGGETVLRAAERVLRQRPEAAAFPELLAASTDVRAVEGCAEAWLGARPRRFDVEPAPLRAWLARAGVGPVSRRG